MNDKYEKLKRKKLYIFDVIDLLLASAFRVQASFAHALLNLLDVK